MTFAESSEWLYRKLKKGKRISCKVIKEEAKAMGISMTNLRCARINLGVKTEHVFPTLYAEEDWLWFLEE